MVDTLGSNPVSGEENMRELMRDTQVLPHHLQRMGVFLATISLSNARINLRAKALEERLVVDKK